MYIVSYYLCSDRVELMGAMDGCVGTIAEQLVIARTPSKVQIDINKMHLVSALSQIASCQ